jgi:hypothetical protein
LAANLLVGLYVLGWPEHFAEVTPILSFLHNHTPEPFRSAEGDNPRYIWYAMGATQVVFSVHQSPALQRIFTTPMAQYLAKISYARFSLSLCLEFCLASGLSLTPSPASGMPHPGETPT